MSALKILHVICQSSEPSCSHGLIPFFLALLRADPNRLLRNTGFPCRYEDDRLFGSDRIAIAQRCPLSKEGNDIHQPSLSFVRSWASFNFFLSLLWADPNRYVNSTELPFPPPCTRSCSPSHRASRSIVINLRFDPFQRLCY